MRLEDAIITERLPMVAFGRGVGRYPDLKTGRHRQSVPPVSGAVGHFDASVAASFALSGGYVSGWADRSGNGNDFSQATAANEPVLSILALTELGRRHMVYCNVTTRMACAVDASDRTQTVIFTGVARTLPTNGTLIGCSADGGRQIRLTSAGRLEILKSGTSFIFQPSAALTVTAGTPFCIAVVLDSTTCKAWLNNVTPESTSNSTTFTAARTTHLNWKGTPADAQAGDWACGEILIYPTALSDADVDLVRTYLMTKWGI